ncbi:GDP-mannose pyrophosphatase [Cycloclasticus sp. 46_120_T64]|nr:GDP-mannose pyrophosphatase [Cycloclasticus sp. 46_120_T64]
MRQAIKNMTKKLLSDNWYRLHKYSFDFQLASGLWQRQQREVYDRGNGASILLYNPATQQVILTRQFRLPTYLNGNSDGLLIEACAGLLDGDSPEVCIRKETEEETGYQVGAIKKVFQAYMSPGAVTEIIHFFIAEYSPEMKISEGGGLADEQENIEVLELGFDEAYTMIETGDIVDAKTIMLLQYVKLHGL